MMNKYESNLLKSAQTLKMSCSDSDVLTELVQRIIESQDEGATIELCQQISSLVDKNSTSIEVRKNANALKDWLVRYYGHLKISQICNTSKSPKESTEDSRSLNELLAELDDLIGLEKVKEQVSDLIAYQKVQKLRQAHGLFSNKNTMHLAFTGNPGTGKTTVARIIGRIYKQIGLLSKGQFIEVSRTDLIAGYQGQTALKVKAVIEQAKGGVLFIDEAYSITENDHSDSYGRECLTELTKALEDYRDDLVVIVAGYTEPMRKFFESNPGLRSRFNHFIEFDDYNEKQLFDILQIMCRQNAYCLTDGAEETAQQYIKMQVDNKEEQFANGRLIRNLFDDIVMKHARRVVKLKSPTYSDLITIESEDFEI